MFSIQGIDNIYFERTKEYFKEVISSFFNENYRSSIVMLYSTVICDICLKLRELENVYSDLTAKRILTEVGALKNGDNKSAWEKKLIDLVYEHKYINTKLQSDINHLYSDRCFSSHPSMDEDYKLMSPSKEMTIAHIKNMLEELFVEPPTFNKSMINEITDDLEHRKTAFADDEQIKQFLDSAYYSRMNEVAKTSLFASLWGFCFNKPNDEKCKNNADINRKALIFLCSSNYHLFEKAKLNGFHFKISDEGWCIQNLCEFLSTIDGYAYIDSNDKILISKAISENTSLKIISWFCYNSFDEFDNAIKTIVKSGFMYDFDTQIMASLQNKYVNEGRISDFLDICIMLFNNVCDFYATIRLYNKYIRPFLMLFDENQLEQLLKIMNDNRCIRDTYSFDPTEIYKVYKSKLKRNPDFSKYSLLKRNPEYIEAKDDNSD